MDSGPICPDLIFHVGENLPRIGEFKKVDLTEADDYPISQLDHKFIVGFETFLRKLYPKHKQGKLSNNGAMKHIQRLRKMTRMAVDNEWLDRDPFRRFKVRMERKEKEFHAAYVGMRCRSTSSVAFVWKSSVMYGT